MTKNWIGLSLAAVALTVSVSTGFACDQQAPAADSKEATDAKDAKTVAANGHAAGCDMPCCAHAKDAVNDKNAANAPAEKPCAAHDAKGCPKKAAPAAVAAAKSEPAKDAAKAQPAAAPGTHR